MLKVYGINVFPSLIPSSSHKRVSFVHSDKHWQLWTSKIGCKHSECNNLGSVGGKFSFSALKHHKPTNKRLHVLPINAASNP